MRLLDSPQGDLEIEPVLEPPAGELLGLVGRGRGGFHLACLCISFTSLPLQS